MKFLVLLLTFMVQRKFNLTLSQQHDNWAFQFLGFFENRFPVVRHNTVLYLAIAIVLPALTLMILLILIDDMLFGVATLFVNFVMLFMCLGCGFLKETIDAYLQFWQEKRYQLALETLASADIYIENAHDLNPAQLHRAVCHKFMYLTFQRFFMIIFWFMVGGPVAALVARLAHVSAIRPSAYRPEHVSVLGFILEWIPGRILSFSFALVGNFSGAMKQGLNSFIDPHVSALDVLKYSASGALDLPPLAENPEDMVVEHDQPDQDVAQLESLRDILNRALIVWFAVLAVLTITGWLS